MHQPQRVTKKKLTDSMTLDKAKGQCKSQEVVIVMEALETLEAKNKK